MKILLSINTAWNIANFRAGLIRGLQAAGHEVICAAPPDGHEERVRALGCVFHALPMDNKGASPLKDVALLRRYLTLFRAVKPDAYLGYTIKPNVYGTLAARLCGIPAINNVSGLGTAFITDSWLTHVVKQLYRLAFKSSATVFFQNADDQTLFADMGLVDPAKTAVLPGSGIDLHHFLPSPLPGGDTVTFLMIARMIADKGVREFADAARIVKRDHSEARFCLLGFLDVENRTAITRAVMDGWVSDGLVEYLGTTNDVRPAIQSADCVVLPSYREGTPRTLLEAAAMGRPLITTDVPGCREPLEDGVNGYLCEVRNAQSLALAIKRFLQLTPRERETMGAASRSLAERRYDEKIVIDAYLAALDRALPSSGRQTA